MGLKISLQTGSEPLTLWDLDFAVNTRFLDTSLTVVKRSRSLKFLNLGFYL